MAKENLAALAAPTGKLETATFAAGCFWGVEAIFQQVKGVKATQVGYAGGTKDNPTYKEVCTGKTGHAEACEVKFDPSVVTYEALLGVFFRNHDPTTLNRQGPDIGSQYRSAIFHHSFEQEKAAKAVIQKLEKEKKFRNKITTKVVPAPTFWRAEEYHQKYAEKNGGPSCHKPLIFTD